MGESLAFFQGKVVKLDDAKVGIMTHALHYGTGAFGGMRAIPDPNDSNSILLFRGILNSDIDLNGRTLLKWNHLILAGEFFIGILNGIFWSCIVAVIVILWFGQISLGIIIGASMIINLIIAALAGATIPIILKRYGIDPAIAGGVILTTVTWMKNSNWNAFLELFM